MAVLDFDVDILGLGIPPLGPATDEPYQTGESEYPDRYDDLSEQRIIVMLDVMRAYLETLTRRDELQRFHHAMSRVLGEVAYNRVYDDIGAGTLGNVPVTGAVGTETVGVDVIDPTNTPTVIAPAVVGAAADLATLVANINGLVGWAASGVEAYAEDGKLGFRLTAAGEAAGSTFVLTGDLIGLVGVKPGPYVSAVRAAARRARDKGLEHFHKEIRADAQP